MKKRVFVLLIISLVALSSFVIAESGCAGRGVHGVDIGGVCFDCGDDDGICPIEFGVPEVDCPNDPNCVYETRGYWSSSGSGTPKISDNSGNPFLVDLVGDSLYLVLTNTGLSSGENVTFDIWERDTGFDDNLTLVIGTVVDGTAIAEFYIDNIDDLNEEGKDENEEGKIQDLYFLAKGITSETLFINTTYSGEGPSTKDCGIYETSGECDADDDEQGGVEHITYGEGEYEGCEYISYTVCTWDGDSCNNDLGPESVFEGDEEICEGGKRTITCSYESGDPIGDCQAGDAFFKATYTSGQEGCSNWTSGPIPCPRKLSVPFFGVYSFIVSLFIIGLLYLFLERRFIK